MPIPLDLIRYYASNDEATRYQRQQLEFEISKRFLSEWLPKEGPKSVLEVGAGSGHYTRWLLEHGYKVVSIEPTPELVVLLEELRKAFPDQLEVIQGDDQSLAKLDKKFDRILLMGPMYHLFQIEERVSLLTQAQAKLAQDGEIFSVFLSRIGFLSYLIKNQPELLAENPDTVAQVIQNGFDATVAPQGYFRGNFDTLQSAVELHQKAGLSVLKFVSLDPLIGPHDESFNNLTEHSKPFWLEVAYHVSTWPEVLGSARTWGFISR